MDAKTSKLKKEIFRRKGIIAEVVEFIEKFVFKEGEITKRDQGSSNTHVVREFKDFAGFHMLYSSGETMFGGTTVKLIFNSVVVFNISYQSSLEEDCRVFVFSEETKWLLAFRSAMKNKDKIFQQRSMEKIKKERDRIQKMNDQRAKDSLLQEAERLDLLPSND